MVPIEGVSINVAIGRAATSKDLNWVSEARLLYRIQRWTAQQGTA